MPKTQKSISSRVAKGAGLFVLAGTLLASTNTKAESVDISVPKAVVAAAFNVALNSTKIYIDNFGKEHKSSWHDDKSYIMLPGGSKKEFSIPEHKYEITPTRNLKHYLHNIETYLIKANVNGGRIEVKAFFESQGEEIKGKCAMKRLRKWKECGNKKFERDGELDNTIVSITLKPVAYNGSISYSDPQVIFSTDLKINNKLCQALNGICNSIENKIHKKLKANVENQIRSELAKSTVKNEVAKAIKSAPVFHNLVNPAWKVTKLSDRGDNFIVTVERPDAGNEKS